MTYPIVQIKTPDDLWFYGLFIEAPEAKAIFINIHGTASNFFEEDFIETMAERFGKDGISMLSTNNRGAGVYDAYQGTGTATEKFEDCVIDIDAWVEFAMSRGYKKVFLSGHSLGAEKIVYYMGHGKHADMVAGLVLLAPADSYGSHRMHDGKPNTEVHTKLIERMKEAEALISAGKGDTFLPRDTYGSHGGIMPKTADSLVDFLGPDSKLLRALPFATGKLGEYGKINLPILVAIGDQDEYTALAVADAIALMKKENSLTEVVRFKDCNHDFEEHEDELAEAVARFIKSRL